MRWALMTLVGVCTALWVDALTGGHLVSGTAAVVIVAVVSVVAGLRVASMLLVVAGVVSVALLSVADQVAEPGRFTLASDGVFYCVVVFTPALIGWLIARRSRQVARLRVRRRTLHKQREVTVTLARAAERERVVRGTDLSLAERLGQMVADVRNVAELSRSDPRGVVDRLVQVEESARDALDGLRDVLGTLRAPAPVGPPDPIVVAATASVPPVRGDRRIDLLDAALVAASVPLAIETALSGHPSLAVLNVPAALAQGLALVLLRRRPLTGVTLLLAVAIAQTAVLAPLPPTVSWLLPGLSAALLLGLNESRSAALIGLLVLVTGVVVVSLATPADHRASGGLVPGLIMGLLVWIGGRCVAAAQARAQELRTITEELHSREQEEVQLAVLQQRAEMARDLHDAGAHALTVVCLQAAAARTWWQRDPDQAHRALDSLTTVAETTVSHVGQSLRGYADGTTGDPLDLRTMDGLVGMGRALGLDVNLGVSGQPRDVPVDVVQVIYRVVQEGLTNAARYAAGTSVRIGLAYRQDALEVHILDTGASSVAVVALRGTGAGLTGMRERVEALRGELRAGPCGRGFEISARLPT